MARGETEVVERTLDAMACGGIHDQVGGGFARYSVDAVLARPPLREDALRQRAAGRAPTCTAGRRSATSAGARSASDTLDWALREMRGPEGGFYSALDADSEGEEGRFYVWSRDELRRGAGRRRARATRPRRSSSTGASPSAATSRAATSSTSPAGRCADAPAGLDRAREALLRAALRARLARASTTSGILSWNALMIGALAEAGAALGRADYLEAAVGCAEFVWERDARRRGPPAAHVEGRRGAAQRLPRGPRLPGRGPADPVRGDARRPLVRRRARDRRRDDRALRRPASNGGFFTTSHDHEELVARRKDVDDHPIPSGNSSAAYGLLRLAALTGERAYEDHAVSVFRLLRRIAAGPSRRRRRTCCARSTSTSPAPRRSRSSGPRAATPGELARGRPRRELRPHLVLAGGPEGTRAARADARAARALDGAPAAYVCERFACKRPVSDPAELAALLGDPSG